MGVNELFLDANLLVLLVVGLVDKTKIGKHRRTKEFSQEDYSRLRGLLEGLDSICVTPNTLTEASNLLGSLRDPRMMQEMRYLVEESRETVVDSKAAVRHRKFPRVGLTDAVLLEVVSAERPLLTTDFELYGLASAKGEGVAFNFWYMHS